MALQQRAGFRIIGTRKCPGDVRHATRGRTADYVRSLQLHQIRRRRDLRPRRRLPCCSLTGLRARNEIVDLEPLKHRSDRGLTD